MHLRKKGFTMIELVVVIAILAVFTAIVVVQYRGYIKRQQVKAATEEIVAELRLAQSEAVKFEQYYSAVFSPGKLVIKKDVDEAGAGGEIVKEIYFNVPVDISFSNGKNIVIFDPFGRINFLSGGNSLNGGISLNLIIPRQLAVRRFIKASPKLIIGAAHAKEPALIAQFITPNPILTPTTTTNTPTSPGFIDLGQPAITPTPTPTPISNPKGLPGTTTPTPGSTRPQIPKPTATGPMPTITPPVPPVPPVPMTETVTITVTSGGKNGYIDIQPGGKITHRY
ncbi:MAG: prepilin-type N-terminal cleavage/methylation domain-containing protein [Armatimonadota bacterium]